MTAGPIVEEQVRVIETQCRHHWVIEAPQGATSHGVCKRCGAQREFSNSVSDTVWEGDPLAEAGGNRWTRPSVTNIVRDDDASDA